jgi:hypothetical protein
MSNPVTSYTDAVVAKFKRYAAWPPNAKLRLGDIGILENNLFRYRSNLEFFGIKFKYWDGPSDNVNHSSGFDMKFSGKLGGQAEVAAPVSTNASLSFSKRGAFVFQATGCRDSEIDDKLRLSEDLRHLYDAKVWDPQWFVIENLTKVERATIIVADSDGGSLELSADGGFPVGGIQLAGVRGSLQVASQSGDFTTFLAEQEITPMFQLLRVKLGWLETARDLIKDVRERLEWFPPRTETKDVSATRS